MSVGSQKDLVYIQQHSEDKYDHLETNTETLTCMCNGWVLKYTCLCTNKNPYPQIHSHTHTHTHTGTQCSHGHTKIKSSLIPATLRSLRFTITVKLHEIRGWPIHWWPILANLSTIVSADAFQVTKCLCFNMWKSTFMEPFWSTQVTKSPRVFSLNLNLHLAHCVSLERQHTNSTKVWTTAQWSNNNEKPWWKEVAFERVKWSTTINC